MPTYRIVEIHTPSADLADLEDAIELAIKLGEDRPDKQFAVERVERVWPNLRAKKFASNAIHA